MPNEVIWTQLMSGLRYHFKDAQRLILALTHRSANSMNNERLEFLGDAILGAVIAEALYARYPDANEGELTRMRSQLVQKASLVEVADTLHLSQYLQLSDAERRSGGLYNPTIKADALEAIIGAIYLDGGFLAASACILDWFAVKLAGPLSPRKDPKTALQEYCHARALPLPAYRIEDIQGAAHAQIFIVNCHIPGTSKHFSAQGNSRRQAEFAVAQQILEYLR